jgi:plastocyanin
MLTRTTLTVLVIAVIYLTTVINMPNAAAQNTTTATTTNSTTTLAPTSSSHKIFYLFSAKDEGVNETKLGVPPDTFSPDILVVNEGNNVTIHFYNLDLTDRHTFTIGAPYNINKDLLPGTNATLTFKAGDQGVFKFYCIYHQPTMSGQLVVLPPPSVEKTSTVTK